MKLYSPRKLPGLSSEMSKDLLPLRPLIIGYVGSIAHNTYIPHTDEDGIDDKDLMCVYVSGLDKYFGLTGYGTGDRGTSHRQYLEWDVTSYDVRKYFHLLLKGNPNVYSLLWLRPNNYHFVSELGQEIIDNRMIFASKQAYKTFCGYAYGQSKRMEQFRFEGYQGEKRKYLVNKFGYDCKNAAHLIRIMRMCIEFLNDGELNVFREDAELIKQIKRGEWSLEQVKEEANRLFRRAEDAYDRSKLPSHPNKEKAESLCIHIIMRQHSLNIRSDQTHTVLGKRPVLKSISLAEAYKRHYSKEGLETPESIKRLEKLIEEEDKDANKFYCFKCRQRAYLKQAKHITLKNNRPAIRGICSVCGAKMYRLPKR